MTEDGTIRPERIWVTISLILVNLAVYLVCNLFLMQKGVDIYELYDNNWIALIRDHEYYRLITSMFIHGGTSHLVNNMMVLFVIGSRYEASLGHARTFISYFSGGILAGVFSMLYNMIKGSIVGSVGASGAIFALVGAFFAAIVIYKGRLQGVSIRQMLIFIVFSLYGGFTNANVDNVAHIAGLACGFVIGLVVAAIGNKKISEKNDYGY